MIMMRNLMTKLLGESSGPIFAGVESGAGAGSGLRKDSRCSRRSTALAELKTAIYKAVVWLGYACEAGSGPCFILWEMNGSLYSQSTL
ncbi:protein E18A [Elephant endotheliotropic herpesvirus 2]|nr:protein E18A [Elephant endotheliotropic herpesvirus 2]